MPKIVFLDAKTLGNVPNLNQLSELGELVLYPATSASQVQQRVKDCEIIITNKVVIDRQTISQSPKLRLICVAATGMNNVDVAFAQEKGIPVKNVVGYSTHSVAQHTFAMFFYLLEQLKYYDQYVQQGAYAGSNIFTHLGREYWEIHGKTFGIIGLGTIGRQVAAIASVFGASVIYFSTSGKNDNTQYKRVELDTLLQTSDIVSIHAPLNEATRNLLDYEKICRMKKTAFLLNTGRGGIINESDLARALDEDRIQGAGLDVLEAEPIAADNPLLYIQNKERLLITPHIAWTSLEARTVMIDNIYSHIKAFTENT